MSPYDYGDWVLPEPLAAHVDPGYRSFAGPGWHPILARLHDRLAAIDPDYRLDQVKEKFGVLRVYPADEEYAARRRVLDAIEAAIADAVRESAATCERCGQPGRLRSEPEWRGLRHRVLTLCDRCVAVELADYGVPGDAVTAFVDSNT
ncbi:MAG: hypothetical protein WD689_05625 [Gaiellaceae bacterium]